jgi:hypothetical protein
VSGGGPFARCRPICLYTLSIGSTTAEGNPRSGYVGNDAPSGCPKDSPRLTTAAPRVLTTTPLPQNQPCATRLVESTTQVPERPAGVIVFVRTTLESFAMDIEKFTESMRVLCADGERLRELGLRVPIEELAPAILATLDDLESGRLAVPVARRSIGTADAR